MFNIAVILCEALIQFHQHPQPVRQQPGGGNHTDGFWNGLTLFLAPQLSRPKRRHSKDFTLQQIQGPYSIYDKAPSAQNASHSLPGF
jgi:hypothetical protein